MDTQTLIAASRPAADLGRGQRLLRRLRAHPTVMIGGSIFIAILLLCWVMPLLVPLEPYNTAPVNRLLGPSGDHLFGTDALGRDVLSRVVIGGRNSLWAAAAITVISSLAGLIIGLYSGFNRTFDAIAMRISDGLMAFPAILLGIALLAAFGATIGNVIIAMSIVFTPHTARVVRSATLVIREQPYIAAAESLGMRRSRVIWVHAVRNLASPLIVQATFVFADALIAEAALSFIGAGIPAPEPSWGNMLLEGKVVIYDAWWMTLFPGLAIVLSVLSVNLLGDGLRDFLDPRQRSILKRGSLTARLTARRAARTTPARDGDPT